MSNHCKIQGAALFVLCSVFVKAETLDQSISKSLKNNKNLQQAVVNVSAAKARLIQAGRMPNPDFEFGVARSNLSRNRITAEFSQAFPLSRRLEQQRAVARIDIASAELEITQFQQGLISEVKSVFLANLYKAQVQKYYTALNEQNAELLKVIKTRIEAGTATAYEAAILEKDVLFIEDKLSSIEAELMAGEFAMLPLLGSAADSFTSEGDFNVEVARLERVVNLDLESVLPRRPDNRLIEINIDRLRSEKVLVKSEARGDMKVGIFVEQENGGRDPNETYGGVKFSFPLPLWNRNQGAILEKEALVQKGIKALEGKRFEVKAEIQIAQNNRKKLKELCSKYKETLLPASEKAYQLALAEYQLNTTTIERVLQAAQSKTDAHLATLDCEKRYAEALIQVERVQGISQQPKTTVKKRT